MYIVVVDTSLSTEAFNIRAFHVKSLKIDHKKNIDSDDSSFANLFVELKVQQEISEAESSPLYHMIHFQEHSWKSAEVLANIPSGQDRLYQSLEKLNQVIDKLLDYVNDVVEGKVVGSTEIGMTASDILGSIQTISFDNLNSIYHEKVQDLLMVSYLSTLTKTQVLLSEKLNAIL